MPKTKQIYYRDWDELPVVLNMSQCAVILDITYETARKWAKNGTLPGVKIGDIWCVEKVQLKQMFERMLKERSYTA